LIITESKKPHCLSALELIMYVKYYPILLEFKMRICALISGRQSNYLLPYTFGRRINCHFSLPRFLALPFYVGHIQFHLTIGIQFQFLAGRKLTKCPPPQLDHASLICKTSSNVIVGKQQKVLVQD